MALAPLNIDSDNLPYIGLQGIGLPKERHPFGPKTILQHTSTGVLFVVAKVDAVNLNNWEFDCLENHKHRWANRRVTYIDMLEEFKVSAIGEELTVCIDNGKGNPPTWYPFDRCNPFRSPLYRAETGTVSKPQRGWRAHVKRAGVVVDEATAFSKAIASPSPTFTTGFVGTSTLRSLVRLRAGNTIKLEERRKQANEELLRLEAQREAYAEARREEEEIERRLYNITRAEPPGEVTLPMLQAPTSDKLRAMIAKAETRRTNKRNVCKCADLLRRNNCTTEAMSEFLATFPHAWKGWDCEWLPKLIEIEQVMPMGAGEFALLVRFNFKDNEERRCWVLHSRLLAIRATLWDKYQKKLGRISKQHWPEWFNRAEEYDAMCYDAMYQQDADDKDLLTGVCPEQ
jgi:hypothetical protein